MGKKQINQSLKIFSKRAKIALDPEQILLFGSYARNEANEYSDVDVIVVAKKFSQIPEEKRLDILYDLTVDLRPDFHVFGFTPQEFSNSNPLTSLSQIKQGAIPLLI